MLMNLRQVPYSFFYGNLGARKKRLMAFFLYLESRRERLCFQNCTQKEESNTLMCQALKKSVCICPKLYLIYSKVFQELGGFLRIINHRFFWGWKTAAENGQCYLQFLAGGALSRQGGF